MEKPDSESLGELGVTLEADLERRPRTVRVGDKEVIVGERYPGQLDPKTEGETPESITDAIEKDLARRLPELDPDANRHNQ